MHPKTTEISALVQDVSKSEYDESGQLAWGPTVFGRGLWFEFRESELFTERGEIAFGHAGNPDPEFILAAPAGMDRPALKRFVYSLWRSVGSLATSSVDDVGVFTEDYHYAPPKKPDDKERPAEIERQAPKAKRKRPGRRRSLPQVKEVDE